MGILMEELKTLNAMGKNPKVDILRISVVTLDQMSVILS